MPKNKPYYEEFKKNLSVGSGFAESRNDYSIINVLEGKNGEPPTYALGKYQFVPSKWWDKIVAFSKKEDVKKLFPNLNLESFNGNKDLSIYEAFLKNDAFQEMFFEHYVSDYAYPAAERLLAEQNKNQKTSFSLDQMGFLYHYTGEGGAQKLLRTGEDYIPGNEGQNISVLTHMERFNDALSQSGINHIPVGMKNKEDVFKEWKEKIDNVNSTNIDDSSKAKMLEEINYEYYKQGYLYKNEKGQTSGVLADAINDYNSKKEAEYTEKHDMLNNMIDFFDDPLIEKKVTHNGTVLYLYSEHQKINNHGGSLIHPFSGKDYQLKEMFSHYEEQGYKGLNKQLEKRDSSVYNRNKYTNGKKILYISEPFSLNGKNRSNDPLANLIDQEAVSLGYEDPELSTSSLIPKNNILSKTGMTNQPFNVKSLNEVRRKEYVKPDNETFGVPFIDGTWEAKYNNERAEKILKPEIEVEVENENTGETETVTATVETAETKQDLELSAFLKSFDRLVEPEPPIKYEQKSKLTGEFLGVAASSLVGALYGLHEANKDTPKRDEEISEAVLRYVQEQKKLSEIGLRPEEEAYAKNMLSESYNTTIENLVRASAGNRNLVLGNMGRADALKNAELTKLALADAEAKRVAYAQYGEAIKYINDFEANKAIAQNERDYNEAMLNKQSGGELAAKAFQNLLNEIDYQRNYGPGSLYDAYTKDMYKRVFNVNPDLPDDENTPYTNAYNEKKYKENMEKFGELQDFRTQYFSLSEDEQKRYNDVFTETGSFDLLLSEFRKEKEQLERTSNHSVGSQNTGFANPAEGMFDQIMREQSLYDDKINRQKEDLEKNMFNLTSMYS